MFEEHDQKNPPPQQYSQQVSHQQEPSDIFRDVAENADQQFDEPQQQEMGYNDFPKQGNPQIILYVIIGILGVLVLVLALVLVFVKLKPQTEGSGVPLLPPPKIIQTPPIVTPYLPPSPIPTIQQTAPPIPSSTTPASAQGSGVVTTPLAVSSPTSTPMASIQSDKDTDKDGLTDSEEEKLGTKIDSIDSDSDGLSDREETRVYKTNPLNNDSDNDTYKDGEEIKNGYSPLGPGKLIQAPQ